MISLEFSIPTAVSAEVYNFTGYLVDRLADNEIMQGKVKLKWNANGFAPGIYFGVVSTGGNIYLHKLILE